MSTETYKIIRLYRPNLDRYGWTTCPPRTIKRGLTLEQAQEHCRRPDTRGEGWFDGYQREVV